jgi:hypothetical protein
MRFGSSTITALFAAAALTVIGLAAAPANAEVVDPPKDVESASVTPPPAQKVFVYPRKGQSAEQEAKDRYECHRWAVDQTGFDPTTATGDTESTSAKRADYQRATSACLEARDYTVR